MDVGFVLFYYSLFVLLASILTSAGCLASYLVIRNALYLFAFAAFLFYFFDVAIVFQDDFLHLRGALYESSPFFIGSPFAAVVFGCGTLTFFWLVICEYLEERRRRFRYLPSLVFVAASSAVLLLVKPGNLQEFVFYGMREALLYWMLAFLAVHYLAVNDEVKRLRMRRHRRLYAALWVLVSAVLAENVVLLLIVGPAMAQEGSLPFFPQRNFSENLLVLCCSIYACKGMWKSLLLRRAELPARENLPIEVFIDQNLVMYARARSLSKREEEVLRQVLLGKDNQNIASELNVASSTVKVHMRHILRKTGRSNRKELIRDFWEFA